MDARFVGQGMRRRMGAPMSHLQMAANAASSAYRMNASGPGQGTPEQGRLFNPDNPKRTYDMATSTTTTDFGGPHYSSDLPNI